MKYIISAFMLAASFSVSLPASAGDFVFCFSKGECVNIGDSAIHP